MLLLFALAGATPALRAQQPLDLEAAVRLALEANPDFRASVAALEATRADVTVARAGRLPSVALSASAARYDNGGLGTMDRHDVGLGVRQMLYEGGRVAARVDAASSALAAGEGGVASLRADLVLAVTRTWYQVAQGERLVRSAEEGLERSRLHLEYADAQLEAGMGTRPDVLRARVDVSAAELDLTSARNALEGARALLNTLMGRPPSAAVEVAAAGIDAPLPPTAGWEELRERALSSRDEVRVARARTGQREALLSLARGARLPSVSLDAGMSRGALASAPPSESWSVGLVLSVPLFEGFALAADVRAERALLDAARHDETAVAQQIEGEVWSALLAEEESARRLDNARALHAAATENLEAAEESYRQGLGSMLALVDARAAFTGAEQTLIQAVYDRRITRAALERAVEGDTWGSDRS